MKDSDATIQWHTDRTLSDFDPTQITPVEVSDRWEDWILTLIAHALFLGGLGIVALMWWLTGKTE